MPQMGEGMTENWVNQQTPQPLAWARLPMPMYPFTTHLSPELYLCVQGPLDKSSTAATLL
jgi:hypothetical protein